MIRKLFQTFAVILFILQFQQSVRKYFQYPVVEQKSKIPVQDLPNPVVYVCHESQLNYSRALANGYTYISHFLLGIITNSTKISWKGKYQNTTYKDLENTLLNSNYSTMSSESLLSSTNTWNVDKKKKIFLLPHGVCLEIKNSVQISAFIVKSRQTINIYFVDPARANNIRTEETLEGKARMGTTSNTYYSSGKYKLEYSLYDESIHDGTTCTDYTKLDMNYGECLNNVLTQEFLATYSCLPPWVSTNRSKIICKDKTNIDAMAMQETPLYNNIMDLVKNYDTGIFKRCLPPCKTMKIKLQEVSYRSNEVRYAFFEARSTDWATVYTQVYSYNMLSLTVDLGSALGLWLGLSCLRIPDYILENWIWMMMYLKE